MSGGSRTKSSGSWHVFLAFIIFAYLVEACLANFQTLGIHVKHRNQLRHREGNKEQGRDKDSEDIQQLLSLDGELNLTKSQHYEHVCKIMADVDKFVMAAGEKYDLDWLRDLELPHIQYQSSDPTKPHYFVDNANEGGAYTQFIYDYYDCLPKIVAFVHGHGGAGWHNDDMTEVMKKVDWEKGPNFIDINRNPNDTVRLLGDSPARPPQPIAWGADAYNGGHNTHQIIGGIAYESFSTHLWLLDQSYMRFYDKHLGPEGFGEMPGSVRVTCCAQFVVRKEAMRLRSRDFYKRTLEYLADNDLRGNNRWDSKYVRGDAMSVFWSMIFGAANITPMRDCNEYAKDGMPARCMHL